MSNAGGEGRRGRRTHHHRQLCQIRRDILSDCGLLFGTFKNCGSLRMFSRLLDWEQTKLSIASTDLRLD